MTPENINEVILRASLCLMYIERERDRTGNYAPDQAYDNLKELMGVVKHLKGSSEEDTLQIKDLTEYLDKKGIPKGEHHDGGFAAYSLLGRIEKLVENEKSTFYARISEMQGIIDSYG